MATKEAVTQVIKDKLRDAVDRVRLDSKAAGHAEEFEAALKEMVPEWAAEVDSKASGSG